MAVVVAVPVAVAYVAGPVAAVAVAAWAAAVGSWDVLDDIQTRGGRHHTAPFLLLRLLLMLLLPHPLSF